VAGHISEALRTTVLPQASGMAIARVPRMTGAFHGAMPTQTPAGWRMPMARLPGLSEGIISPEICVVIDAASRRILAASMVLKPPQGPVEPVSAVISRANSPALLSITSAAFSSSLRRCPGPMADQAGKAAAAASQAARASSGPPARALVATSPVTGSNRSNRLPDAAARSSLSIRSRILSIGSSHAAEP
jgi:hypothetical protein